MKRKSTAVWKGTLKEGEGALSAGSGAFTNTKYSFGMRFGDEPGTNPEELIAAAHAGCFAMALAGNLEKEGASPKSIEVEGTVELSTEGGKATVTASHLQVSVSADGIGREDFERAVEDTRTGCPISRLLNANITVDARLH